METAIATPIPSHIEHVDNILIINVDIAGELDGDNLSEELGGEIIQAKQEEYEYSFFPVQNSKINHLTAHSVTDELEEVVPSPIFTPTIVHQVVGKTCKILQEPKTITPRMCIVCHELHITYKGRQRKTDCPKYVCRDCHCGICGSNVCSGRGDQALCKGQNYQV
jgi:hypothetical protein